MKMKTIIRCIHCNKNYDVWVDPKDLTEWANGGLIQDILHYLTPGERELLMSGTCDACWKKMFGEDEAEDEADDEGDDDE